jgi:hypothetical protein
MFIRISLEAAPPNQTQELTLIELIAGTKSDEFAVQ